MNLGLFNIKCESVKDIININNILLNLGYRWYNKSTYSLNTDDFDNVLPITIYNYRYNDNILFLSTGDGDPKCVKYTYKEFNNLVRCIKLKELNI